jgi:beta-galactosidase
MLLAGIKKRTSTIRVSRYERAIEEVSCISSVFQKKIRDHINPNYMKATRIVLNADRNIITADAYDLSFITVKVVDKDGITIPDANNKIVFTIEGPGEIVATDNGDPADLLSFASKERRAYSGLALAIVRFEKGKTGIIKISASSEGLKTTALEIKGN